MATTSYGVNANEAVKVWSKALAREVLKQTQVGSYIGSTSDSLIQVKTELTKGPGDRIRNILRMQLAGDGVVGDGTLEGNEEALITYTDDVLIDQLRHAVRSAGKMSEQRIPFSIREEAKLGLADWMSARLDTWFFNHIAGYSAQTDSRYTGFNSIVAPTSTRIIRAGGAATDDVIASTAKFSLTLVDAAKEMARTATPAIRPVKVRGQSYYVMFLHPYQVTDLRTSTTTGQWLDIQKAKLSGNGSDDNAIFTGEIGVYNGVMLVEGFRVPQGLSAAGVAQSNVRRAVLCGAQACTMAFGQGHSFEGMDWSEELFDYGNQLGVKGGVIGGLKKTQFNSTDFGTVVVSTWAAQHTS